MEEGKSIGKSHRAVIANRKSALLTGVVDVISFDLSEILLETELGMLQIKGNDLHVNRLSLEKGEVDLEGRLDSLTYTDTADYENKSRGMLGRLFG